MKFDSLCHVKPRLVLAMLASAILAVSCANLPPPKVAQDFKAIEGKWEGSFKVPSGRSFPATTSVGQDGRWETLVPALGSPGPRFVGTMSIVAGKYRYKSDTTGTTGTCTLHEGDSKRVLVVAADDGSSSAEYRPAK